MKICFVVHRYAPYPGGSEYYTQQMAEECVRRGIETSVFSSEHMGDLNGVTVSSNVSVLQQQDLIVVHGGDIDIQNFVLKHAKVLGAPVLYLLIKPSESEECLKGLENAAFIGCSAMEDWEHVKKWKVVYKSYQVRHGISGNDCLGIIDNFKFKYNIPLDKRMFLSCGGYWPNKRMIELCEAFNEANLHNTILVTTGYDNRRNLMPHASKNVYPLLVADPRDIKNAIADADCYIMNSDAEGFGLVLLESMLNRTPWISRNIAGAKLLNKFGITYETEGELVNILQEFDSDKIDVESAYDYVIKNHMISNTVDDILSVIKKASD